MHLQRLFRLLAEYLLLLPIFLVGGILLSDHGSIWVWLGSFSLSYGLGFLCKMVFKKQPWWIYAILIMVMGITLGLVIGEGWVTWILLIIIYPVVIYRGMGYVLEEAEDIMPISILWVGGFIIYFVAYLFFRFLDVLVDYLPIITVSGIAFIVLTLFLSNSEQLKKSTLSKTRTPAIHKTIKRQNKLYLSLTVIVIFLLSIGTFVQDRLLGLIRWFLNLLAGDGEIQEVPMEEPPSGNSNMSGLFNDDVKEPSLFWEILEKITIYIVYAGLILLAIILLLLLVKKTRTWLVKLFNTLINFLKQLGGRFKDDAENTIYEEEKTSIFNLEEWTNDQKQRMKSLRDRLFRRKTNWKTLSNREKVRFVYRNFILRHANDKIGSATPREILVNISNEPELNAEKIAALQHAYEKVRYGDREISDAEVEEIYQLIQK